MTTFDYITYGLIFVTALASIALSIRNEARIKRLKKRNERNGL